MFVPEPGLATLLPLIPLLLVHLTGIVVAVVLLGRQDRRREPALLALAGFTLLFLVTLANFARRPLIVQLARQTGARIVPLNTAISCCYSVFQVAGGLCLIVAIWQAVTGAEPPEMATEPKGGILEER